MLGGKRLPDYKPQQDEDDHAPDAPARTLLAICCRCWRWPAASASAPRRRRADAADARADRARRHRRGDRGGSRGDGAAIRSRRSELRRYACRCDRARRRSPMSRTRTGPTRPAHLFRDLLAETIRARTDRPVLDPRDYHLAPGLRLTGRIQQFGLDGDTMPGRDDLRRDARTCRRHASRPAASPRARRRAPRPRRGWRRR